MFLSEHEQEVGLVIVGNSVLLCGVQNARVGHYVA